MKIILEYEDFNENDHLKSRLIEIERKFGSRIGGIDVTQYFDSRKQKEIYNKIKGFGLDKEISKLIPMDIENPEERIEYIRNVVFNDKKDLSVYLFLAIHILLSIPIVNENRDLYIKWEEVK